MPIGVLVLGSTSALSCPICSYSLTGLPTAGRCPECGCSYDERILSARSARPAGGWASLLGPPLAALLAMPLLTYLGFPVGFVASLIFVAWCWHASKRLAAWRYEVRVKASLRGARPKPPGHFRPAIQHLAFGTQILLIYGIWAVVATLLHLP